MVLSGHHFDGTSMEMGFPCIMFIKSPVHVYTSKCKTYSFVCYLIGGCSCSSFLLTNFTEACAVCYSDV